MKGGKGISQRTNMHSSWTQKQWGDGQREEVENGDICNSVNNKKKVKKQWSVPSVI